MFHFISARIWKVAGASAFFGAVPVPGLSIVVDTGLLTKELLFYNSQLSISNKNCPEQQEMTAESMNIYKITSEVTKIFTAWVASNALEEYARIIPVLGTAFASSISFKTTYNALSQQLDKLKDAALEFIEQENKAVEDDFNKSLSQDIGETEDARGTDT